MGKEDIWLSSVPLADLGLSESDPETAAFPQPMVSPDPPIQPATVHLNML
jgi:hypothetical protein